MFKEEAGLKKVTVIGTHAVGKTTLCRGLANYAKKLGKRVEFVEEVVRGCPYPIHHEQGYNATEWIVINQILAETRAASASPDFIICDRSVLDPLIYHQASHSGESVDLIGLWDLAANRICSYDLVMCVEPSSNTMAPDGFRDTDNLFRDEIDTLFKETLSNHDLTYIEPGKLLYTESEVIFADLESRNGGIFPKRSPNILECVFKKLEEKK